MFQLELRITLNYQEIFIIGVWIIKILLFFHNESKGTTVAM